MQRRKMVLAMIAALLIPACGGGGGGGGGGPTQPPANPAGTVFTPLGAPTGNSVYLVRGAGSTSNRMILEVWAEDVDSLYSVSFDLAFPPGLLTWDPSGTDEGPFLSRNGNARTELLVADGSPGILIVGLSRLGATGGRAGSGRLLSLAFTNSGTGNGDLAFSRNLLVSPDGTGQSGVTWLGGSVRVTS